MDHEVIGRLQILAVLALTKILKDERIGSEPCNCQILRQRWKWLDGIRKRCYIMPHDPGCPISKQGNSRIVASSLPYSTGNHQSYCAPGVLWQPAGGHAPVDCWVYSADGSEFELIFGFYSNFSPDDLICKTVHPDFPHTNGAGGTIQFNGTRSFKDEGTNEVLMHLGDITVSHKKSRVDVLEQISRHASDEDAVLGGIEFPFRIGSTADVGELLDRLFVYSYAIEQAKKAFRQEPPFPRLTS